MSAAYFVGRFQPFHKGHHETALKALSKANRLVFVIGSAQASETHKNPFPVSLRKKLIASAFGPIQYARIDFLQINDNPSDIEWKNDLTNIVNLNMKAFGYNRSNCCFICHNKDEETAEYIELLKTILQVKYHTPSEDTRHISATKIRERIFQDYGFDMLHLRSLMPEYVIDELDRWYVKNEKDALRISKNYNYIKSYKKSYETSPYPPILVTVDCIITSFHRTSSNTTLKKFLLIKRGEKSYGAGKWSLVGGFVDHTDKTLKQAIHREVREEIGDYLDYACADTITEASFGMGVPVYSPRRTDRGTSLTFVFNLELRNQINPRIEIIPPFINDEVQDIGFFTMDEIRKIPDHEFFEDHKDLIKMKEF